MKNILLITTFALSFTLPAYAMENNDLFTAIEKIKQRNAEAQLLILKSMEEINGLTFKYVEKEALIGEFGRLRSIINSIDQASLQLSMEKYRADHANDDLSDSPLEQSLKAQENLEKLFAKIETDNAS
jgi:uncharacterized protein Yka (UPF0111/DUF47 family)